MSKEKEEGKEKEKIMETSTIPSSEVITSVEEQLKAIGFKLSFDEYDKVYSVTTYMRFFDIQSYIPELIKVLESPYANFVTKLDLASRHLIGDTKAGIKELFKALKSTNITNLNLTDNNLGNEGAIALAETIKYSNVTVLNLRNTKIGKEGAEALANALKEEGNKITNLNLMDNKLEDEGARAIAEAIKHSNVTELYLSYNFITMEGARAIAEALKDSKVTGLSLMQNSIGDEGAKAIAKAIKNGWEPTVLDLAGNRIGDEGAKAIAEALKGRNIIVLNLAGNRIGDEGAKALAEALKNDWKPTTLYLSSNNIGDEGAEALAEALEKKDSAIKELSINNNNIGGKGIKALTEKVPQGIVHIDFQNPLLTSSTASTTTTSVSTISSFDNSRSTKKKEGKEKEKMKEAIIAGAINTPELSSFDKIYGNLVKEPGKSLTTEEVTKLGDQYLTSDRILNLFSKNPKKAYEELITAHKFDTGMFIKLVVYQQVCSIGKFAFEHHKYLLDSVKNGTFNLSDPMLLAYAVRLSNEELALSVTKELVRKGAVIADNILFHSYNNPHVTKFLLREKPSIITCQDKLMGTDAVIKKVQGKLFTSASETDKVKFKTTLELLKAAKTGGDDLNIKLDIICPPIFDNEYSKALFEIYSKDYPDNQWFFYNITSLKKHYKGIEKIIKDGGNFKGVSKEFENYVRKVSSAEIVKLLFTEPISQDVSSTASTTTTSVSTTFSLEKFASSSSSSTSESYTTKTAVSTPTLPLGGTPTLYNLLSKKYVFTDKSRVSIDQVRYNTKITKNKVELRNASDELVCTVQIENGKTKLIYDLLDIYTVDEDGFLSHNIYGRYSGFLDLDSANKREIIRVCENLLKQQTGGATGSSDSTTLSSSSSSTSKSYTTKAAVSATSSSSDDTVTTSSSSSGSTSCCDYSILLSITESIPESTDSAIPLTGESTIDTA